MNTAELPEKVRAFVAIYPTAEIQSELAAAQNQLQAGLANHSVRWTKPEQIHLTLQFLGYIQRELLGKFADCIERVASDLRQLHLRAESVGCFPREKRPKIIWAGLAGELEPLRALKENLDRALAELGFLPEERKFHAHLTIGRVVRLRSSDARKLALEISRMQSTPFGEWEAREVCLMQSELSSEGARHSVLNAFAIGKI